MLTSDRAQCLYGSEDVLEPTDRELLAEIEAGSDLAFDRLMRRYRRLVYRVAYGFTRDQENALDRSKSASRRSNP